MGVIGRTRVKYASFGQAVAIRAAYNEGIRIPSAGVLYAQHGSLEFVIQPFSVAASAIRYLFDGGGAANKNLVVFITTDGRVQVSYGTGVSTVTMTSTTQLPADGSAWIGIGWDSDGVSLLVDGQLVASNEQAPNLEFGANFYVGCSASQANSLDGLLEEFRISSRKRTVAEFVAAHEAGVLGAPLEWDVDTTYLLHFDGNLNVPAVRQGVWQSPVLLAPESSDYSSLVAYWEDNVPVHTAVVCQVRTSPDGQNWSFWYDTINGDFSTAPPNPYAQVRFILQTLDEAAVPAVNRLVASFEGMPTAELLHGGLSLSDSYTFAQLNDTLVICNGVDQPKKFDGETISDIASAPRAALVTVWRNRLFMAKAPLQLSHLYFSDLLNVDSWPATNFIAVNPSDGDEIMALLPTASTLLIVKQHRVYQLQGYSPDTFQVSLVGEGGTISPWGIIDTPYGLFRVDREGVWATDLRRSMLISEDISRLWKQLNQRALKKAVLFYYDQKLLVAVPRAGSNYNDLLLVYDMRHKSWTVWEGWYPSCFQIYWERGKWVYLFGDSRKGNVYAIGEGADDAGQPFEAVVETAHLPLISEEIAKRIKWVDVALGGATIPTTVQVSAVVDGSPLPPREFTVDTEQVSSAYRVYAPSQASTVGIRLVMPQATANGPTLLGMVLTYFQQAIRPRVVF
ncbi:LamG domain-containing protein [Caldanaerobius polysaccharolyticus]|uniref:LamG domain-containing protein n=1 Tax=Caldanaerobius polysaccharolyticus TaxID=44256 RepID=UPI00146F95B5|nr:LamG domain-containing protein [Caldanaerobius polysaccharolyticus]